VALVYDKCDTVVEVAERAISLRLDEEATRALELLMRDGKSRSEAIREAVVDTARRRLYEIAAADAARVGADEGDRREVAAVQALMEELSEER
jgi:Arc/MetJ-type ribon-helix-helix transcriptional regulator